MWNLRKEPQSDKILSHLKNHIFPYIGKRPITKITALEYLAVCQKPDVARLLRVIHVHYFTGGLQLPLSAD
jgi:hypothetical protein